MNSDKLDVHYSFKAPEQAVKTLGPQIQKKREEKPIVNINGVKWVVNPKDETIFKKNKPAVAHKIEDILDQVDEPTQEKILNFL